MDQLHCIANDLFLLFADCCVVEDPIKVKALYFDTLDCCKVIIVVFIFIKDLGSDFLHFITSTLFDLLFLFWFDNTRLSKYSLILVDFIEMVILCILVLICIDSSNCSSFL